MESPLLLPLLVALPAFCLIWPISVWQRDASLVDIAWGPGFAVQVLLAAWIAAPAGARAQLILVLICVWSGRLGFVLIRRRVREGHEDGRYADIRKSWGIGFWWKSLFIVFALQAVLQWMIALGPIAGVLAEDQSPQSLAVVGAIIAIAGLLLETLADFELDRFKATSRPGALLVTGLRAWVRHPNYVGEIVFWTGVALICVEGGAWLGLVAPVLIMFFLLKVSGTPLLDERLAATRPEYAEYKRKVPALVPRLGSRVTV
ncbi:MAG: DUF1295 domain-containing protein [Paracoccaceae bacterium]